MTVKPPPMSDDERQLKRAIDSLRHTTGVDLTFGGVVTRGRHAQLTEFAGNSTRALMGLTLGFGMGLGGKAVALHRPIAVNDYANSRRISHHYDLMVAAEGIRAVVAAPVVVNRTVRAVMYGAVRQSVGLGDRTVDAVMDTARALEQNLAVRDEVAHRLGRLGEPGVSADHVPEPASPRWETIREAYAELRVLAQHVTDSDLRDRVAMLSDQAGRRRRPRLPAHRRPGPLVARTRRPVVRRPGADQHRRGGRTRPGGRNGEELSAQRDAQAGMPFAPGGGHDRPPPRSTALRAETTRDKDTVSWIRLVLEPPSRRGAARGQLGGFRTQPDLWPRGRHGSRGESFLAEPLQDAAGPPARYARWSSDRDSSA